MDISKNQAFLAITIAVTFVLLIPAIYLLEANNWVGLVIYLGFYLVFFWFLRRIARKYGFDFPKGTRGGNFNSLSDEGKISIMIGSGFCFAAIIGIILRAFADLSETYFWMIFAICFVVGAIIGNAIRKKVQKT
ncbi:MAG: hypothetical protein LBQ98_10745 [Nitrososphaerota archaeon]|jgi:hypothetical protein|nr:hypothetical protein [Nitrososphaerota archaeon]